MKVTLKILLVFPEVTPFTKMGGVADVGSGLPKALKEMEHDVRVIMPQYRVVNERRYVLRDVIRLQDIDVPLGQETVKINVKSAFLPNSKVQVYFIDYKPFFFRDGLYVDPETGKDYPDNDKRFILFAKGVLETLKRLQWQPDVIHCNDWQCGLIPFFLKTLYNENPFFDRMCSLFTIHDFALQGSFDPVCLSAMGVDESVFCPGSDLEFQGQCSFLKAGIVYADVVNTVSERYAQEVRSSPEYGYGMGEVITGRAGHFYGVMNGIDYSVWDPETDSLIPENYSIKNLEGKEKNKRVLLEKHGLPFCQERPVIGMIPRPMDQEGLALVQDSFDEIMRLNVCFVLLGMEDGQYSRFFNQAQKKYPDRVGINVTADDFLNHLIEAGADIFLMPSRYEPCGLLRPLRSLKYGTIPVVCTGGGLTDTVHPFDSKTGKGTGFVFHRADAKDLVKALKQAVRTFEDKATWVRIMKNGMRVDFSWQHSAKKYVRLYEQCISKKK